MALWWIGNIVLIASLNSFISLSEVLAYACSKSGVLGLTRYLAAYYAGRGPQHWQVFYDTLDRFPTTGPIPAPPQQVSRVVRLPR